MAEKDVVSKEIMPLIGDSPKRMREYVRMIEILSDNRDLENEIREAETMLTEVKLENPPSFNIPS